MAKIIGWAILIILALGDIAVFILNIVNTGWYFILTLLGMFMLMGLAYLGMWLINKK